MSARPVADNLPVLFIVEQKSARPVIPNIARPKQGFSQPPIFPSFGREVLGCFCVFNVILPVFWQQFSFWTGSFFWLAKTLY